MIIGKYKIEFAPRIEKQLKKIPEKIRKQILSRIENLELNPRPENIEPLQGIDKGLFRIRQGDYRIVYSIQDKTLVILVLRVVHRKEIYTKKTFRKFLKPITSNLLQTLYRQHHWVQTLP